MIRSGRPLSSSRRDGTATLMATRRAERWSLLAGPRLCRILTWRRTDRTDKPPITQPAALGENRHGKNSTARNMASQGSTAEGNTTPGGAKACPGVLSEGRARRTGLRQCGRGAAIALGLGRDLFEFSVQFGVQFVERQFVEINQRVLILRGHQFAGFRLCVHAGHGTWQGTVGRLLQEVDGHGADG